MTTCPTCSVEVADEQMEQHNKDNHADAGQPEVQPQGDQPAA